MKTLQEQRTEAVLKMQERISELEKESVKAKEIIKNLLFLHNDKFGSTRLEWRCNVVAEAEQFLKEVEK